MLSDDEAEQIRRGLASGMRKPVLTSGAWHDGSADAGPAARTRADADLLGAEPEGFSGL
jgi:hypothetical protein